jgi:hypothetical protein
LKSLGKLASFGKIHICRQPNVRALSRDPMNIRKLRNLSIERLKYFGVIPWTQVKEGYANCG